MKYLSFTYCDRWSGCQIPQHTGSDFMAILGGCWSHLGRQISWFGYWNTRRSPAAVGMSSSSAHYVHLYDDVEMT
ncbi:hypothetical protein INT44_001669 [Umbelopsis vinacea]|uniref:Uncharacterized protein n=1 Tax=Umbelopsis vinacea TaxID=44442 RepID=A0A8H7PQQ5_9FUNG|nr:hypothetical protein INT44_001669 [Umbelopsis vinacea]